MRLREIEARLAAIATECETASGDALRALETEAHNLTEERNAILADIEARNQLRASIAAGQTGTVVERALPGQPAPAAAPQEQTPEQIAESEMRSFAGFIRGTVSQMRSGEQNFDFANNGALVPTTIASRIIEAVRDMCPIFAGAEMYHVRGTLQIPVYGKANTTHDITVGYAADFAELTADAGAFTSVELKGYLIGALSLIGKSLLNSADIDLVSFVVRKMAEAISVFVENELLNGDGASNSHCTGALSTTNTMKAGSTSTITADNLIDLQAKIKQVNQAGAVWTMHPDTFSVVKKIKDGNGRYLLQDDITGEFPYRLLGKPVMLSDNMPKIASGAKAVLYGNYNGLAVNVHENVSVEVLREKYATQHAVGVVAYMEIDSKVADAQKLATLVMSS